MKKFYFLLIILFTTISFKAFNQNVNGINFQAIAKDQNGNIGKNKNLYVTTSVLKSDENGEIYMKEAFVTKTDNSGIFSITLGKGKIIGGKFSSLKEIEWNNDSYFLNIQMAIVPDDFSVKSEFAGNLINLGTTKFGTVPSAISADFVKGFELKLNIADSSKYVTPTNLFLNNSTILNSAKDYTDKKINEITTTTIGAEPFIKTGTVAQYFRGDKTFQTLDKNTVGLSNVDNTSDINKPVSSATQLAINNATAGNMAGNANTATKLATPRTINGIPFDGTANINITATSSSSSNANTLTGTTLASNVVSSSLTSVGNLTAGGIPYSLLTGTVPTWNQNTTGNAATATTATTANSATTATKLANARTINGIAFDGTADITITGTGSGSSDAGTLTGTTLASNVVSSSLTSVGTISSGTWSGSTIALAKGGTGATTAAGALSNLGAEPAISAGTTSQYFRGDKTFQSLDKAAVGLGNVDNTSDANKPVSTATQTAINNAVAGSMSGNAATATAASKLATARTINGVAFDGTADITITGTGSGSSDAGTLTGTTLASNVVSSSLTSVGTISSGTWNGSTIALAKGGTGATTAAGALSNLGAEPAIPAGTTSQYFRGDKTFQTLDKAAVGLGNVDNTSDANKPVSTATQTAINNAIAGSMSGNAATATAASKLATARTINGVAFDGTADITITGTGSGSSDAGTLTGTTLASNVVSSSLTSVGTISSGTWSGSTIALAKGGTGATTAAGALSNLGAEPAISAGTTSQYFRGDKTFQSLDKAAVGLGNVDNTSDANKPVSTATQTAINNAVAGSMSGNAATATAASKLATARTINGVAFDGTADITITGTGSGSSDAGTLTGTTLASNVVSSSLTSVGTISSGTWNGSTIALAKGGTGATTAAGALSNLGAEPAIPAGTTSQYFRGDKTFQTLDKAAVGLGNVDNTSDANKPVSTATQTAINNAIAGSMSGNAATATAASKLATARTINGVAFDGTADITITGTGSGSSDAGTLTGTTLASNVVSSSLTSVGTISSGTWSGSTIALAKGGTGATTAAGALSNLGAEPAISAGTTSQYFRGDKTFQSLDKAAVGLGNVDNTSDANKPVSTATQTAINNAIAGSMSGNAATATAASKLATARTINGVAFDGTADITITGTGSGSSDAGTLTGTTLASNVVSSSLTSVGTISSGTWNGSTIALAKGGTGATTAAGALSNLGAEPAIPAGTTSQYFRGDKTFQSLDKAAVGLGNVDNTSDASKPVSSATQTALNAKEDASNKSIATDLGGVSASDVSFPSQKAVKSYVDSKTTDASTLTGTTLASNVVSSSLTSVGTISSGTWSGSTIALAKGGTGATTAAGALSNLGAEPAISAGTTSQYFRGDKTFQTLDKAAVGLGNVDNTSDASKPVSSATQTALNAKEDASNKSIATDLGGVSASDVSFPSQKAVKSYVDSKTTDASTLTGTTLASNVVSSSLTSVGTISSGTWNGSTIAVAKGGTGSTNINGVLKGNGTSAITTAAYGSFYDTNTQTILVANTPYPMEFNTTDFGEGVIIENNLLGKPTRIKVSNTGKYNIQFSAQLDRSTGTSAEDVSIWLRKNDSDIAYSCTDIVITGSTASSAPTVAAWNFFQNLNANEYIEFLWSASATNIIIKAQAARTSPTRPGVPSIILTVQQVY